MRARGGAMRLERTLRGEGRLSWGARKAREVSYAIDFYVQGAMRSAAGDVRGDLAAIAQRPAMPARLVLEDGEALAVTLSDIEADCALIELAPGGAPDKKPG